MHEASSTRRALQTEAEQTKAEQALRSTGPFDASRRGSDFRSLRAADPRLSTIPLGDRTIPACQEANRRRFDAARSRREERLRSVTQSRQDPCRRCCADRPAGPPKPQTSFLLLLQRAALRSFSPFSSQLLCFFVRERCKQSFECALPTFTRVLVTHKRHRSAFEDGNLAWPTRCLLDTADFFRAGTRDCWPSATATAAPGWS